MQWWESSEEELIENLDLWEARRQEYAAVFYGTEAGRNVLLDICNMCYTVSSDPSAMLARIEVFLKIKTKAGSTVRTDRAAIDAEALALEIQGEHDAS